MYAFRTIFLKLLRKFNFYLPASTNKAASDTIEYFIGLFCKAGGLVFDIGANAGIKTECYLSQGACVISVEPQSKCIKIMKRKFRKNKNITIVEKAIDEKCGTLDMYICISDPDASISTFSDKWINEGRFSKHHKWDKRAKVETTTLDELIKLYGIPNFCKIDVEGFEVQVLKGLSKQIPLLSFEFTIEFINDAEKCMDILNKLGNYAYNIGFGLDAKFALEKWQSSKDILEAISEYSKTHPKAWGDIYAFVLESLYAK